MTMAVSESGDAQPSRMSAEEVAARLEEGEPVTVLDARSPQAWGESRLKVRGAIRIDRDHLALDPSWPKDRLTVVYCT
jgi:hypothetical protein